MEYLPRIHYIGALHRSPRVIVKIERDTRKIQRTDYLHVHLMGIERQSKNASQVLNSFLSTQRDLEQDNGHSSDLDQKRSGTLLVNVQSTWRMGQNCRADDVKIRRRQTSSLQIHKSIVSRSAQKQRWWKIINTLLR